MQVGIAVRTPLVAWIWIGVVIMVGALAPTAPDPGHPPQGGRRLRRSARLRGHLVELLIEELLDRDQELLDRVELLDLLAETLPVR